MSDIDEKECPYGIRDLPEFFKVERSGIRRSAGKYHLRFTLLGDRAYLIIIEHLRITVHAVRHHIVKFSGKIMGVAVRQMAPARKVHREDRISRFKHREIYDHIRLRAGMRLHVHVLRAE
jgi:hypothetical protein